MKIKIIIDDEDYSGSLPKWYGIAYRQHEVRRLVLAIIPLNLFLRYSNRLYWGLYAYLKHDKWKFRLAEAYRRGFRDGEASTHRHYERLARIAKSRENDRT